MSPTQDTPKVDAIRAAMPVTQQVAYLNSGTSGPISQALRHGLLDGIEATYTQGRASMPTFVSWLEAQEILRGKIADLVNVKPSELALTHHTTDGMNIVIHGLQWERGDEVITTTIEHEGGLVPLYVTKQRHGVELRMVDITAEDDDASVLAKIAAQITPRTKLLLISHVAWNLGNRMPLKEIAALCRQHNVLTLVDAAQSIGAIPVDLQDLGVDFYAMPGQKWLCGPEGVGFLYVREETLSRVNLTFSGFLSLRTPEDWDFTGHFMPGEGAKRFEVGTVFRPGIKAFVRHLEWMEQEVGWEWLFARNKMLNEYAYAALSDIPQVRLLTHPGAPSNLTSFFLEGYDSSRVVTKLLQENIIIRFLKHPFCLRASIGYYNTHADIDHLVTNLRAITAMAPDDLPEYVSPFA